jgi:hypothetical protein
MLQAGRMLICEDCYKTIQCLFSLVPRNINGLAFGSKSRPFFRVKLRVVRRATGRIRQLTNVVSICSATTIDAAALLRRQHARELVNTCATSEPYTECPFE